MHQCVTRSPDHWTLYETLLNSFYDISGFVGGAKVGNLKLGTCSGKRLLQIEIAVSSAVEGKGGGRQLVIPYENNDFCEMSFRFLK